MEGTGWKPSWEQETKGGLRVRLQFPGGVAYRKSLVPVQKRGSRAWGQVSATFGCRALLENSVAPVSVVGGPDERDKPNHSNPRQSHFAPLSRGRSATRGPTQVPRRSAAK